MSQRRRAKPKTRQRPPRHESPPERRARLKKIGDAQRANPSLACSRWVGLPERDEALIAQRRVERNKRKKSAQKARAR